MGALAGNIGFWGRRTEKSRRLASMTRIVASSGVLFAGAAATAKAQYVPNYFQPGVPGYDRELGVTVLTRQRPLYEPPGIQAGGFTILPTLDETIGYNSNLLGRDNSGSWLLETTPSILATSNWSRNRLGASVSADNQHYFNLPNQSLTNWNLSLGGGYTIGESDLTLAYSHLGLHEVPAQVGSGATLAPIPFTVDDFRSDYTFVFGRFSLTPNVEFSLYRYGNTTAPTGSAGLVSHSFADANVLQGGFALRYGEANERNLLLVVQGVDARFPHPLAGTPAPNSTSVVVLGGIDYRASGVFRYQLLVGASVRNFSSQQFQDQVEPVARADLIWTPTLLTTVTGTLIRTIQNPVQAGNSGFTYTSAQLRVDHELRRNILLQGRAGVTNASYFQHGGNQTEYSLGGSVTWLLNRNVRLIGSYDYNRFTGSGSPMALAAANAANAVITGNVNSFVNTGAFSQDVVLLTLHFGI
jgi:hypothetical protein